MTIAQGYQTLTDVWVKAAVEFSAHQTFGGDIQRTQQALSQGKADAWEYLLHSLAQQIGAYLGRTDPTVKAVYMVEAEEPVEFGEAELTGRPAGINLIAWVERKTAALMALTKALEASLAESRRALGCVKAKPECFFLDVHLVDDADVHERRGYGVLVNSVHVEPMKIWTRPVN
jgi:hypothetical protein